MSPILNAMRTYLAPALFNSKVNELKKDSCLECKRLINFLNFSTSVLLLA